MDYLTATDSRRWPSWVSLFRRADLFHFENIAPIGPAIGLGVGHGTDEQDTQPPRRTLVQWRIDIGGLSGGGIESDTVVLGSQADMHCVAFRSGLDIERATARVPFPPGFANDVGQYFLSDDGDLLGRRGV